MFKYNNIIFVHFCSFILLYEFEFYSLPFAYLYFFFKPSGLECGAGSTQTSKNLISLTWLRKYHLLECASALVFI